MNAESSTPAVTETALLGGGCFWCLEAVFDELAGVLSVESGYAGGATPKPPGPKYISLVSTLSELVTFSITYSGIEVLISLASSMNRAV